MTSLKTSNFMESQGLEILVNGMSDRTEVGRRIFFSFSFFSFQRYSSKSQAKRRQLLFPSLSSFFLFPFSLLAFQQGREKTGKEGRGGGGKERRRRWLPAAAQKRQREKRRRGGEKRATFFASSRLLFLFPLALGRMRGRASPL